MRLTKLFAEELFWSVNCMRPADGHEQEPDMPLQFDPKTSRVTYRGKEVGERIIENGRSFVRGERRLVGSHTGFRS